MPNRRRHQATTIIAATAAGLRETMLRLGHSPGPLSDTCLWGADRVTVACTVCRVPLSAHIDYAEERVELTGEALRLRCEAHP